MTTALSIKTSFDWDNQQQLEEIKHLVSQTPLNETEFSYLVQLGKATQLNPFNREIWAIKYSSRAAAQIFIGRDGYRIAASRHPMYLRHQVVAVYSKDEFKVINDEIIHSYGLGDRGILESAYCKVYLKCQENYSYVYVTMKEYGLTQSVWKDKPETMIKKVAEAQALRQSFPDFFAGTYSDAELPQETKPALCVVQEGTNTKKLKNILGIGEIDEKKCNVDILDVNTGELSVSEYSDSQRPFNSERHYRESNNSKSDDYLRISTEQLDRIELLFVQKQFSQERVEKAKNYYKVKYQIDDLEELSSKVADIFIMQLERA